MENKYKNGHESTAKSQSTDTWESIKKEFHNILQNQFNIDTEKPDEPQYLADCDMIPTALMENGLGFSTVQDAILKNIDNSESSQKQNSWNGIANDLLSEHSNIAIHSASQNNSDSEIPLDKLTPFFINIDKTLPFNPANVSNIEESLNTIRTKSLGSSWQHEIYSGFQLMNAFYQSYHKLQAIVALSIPQAALNFEKRIVNDIPTDKDIFSISDLYSIWIECCEEAYLHTTASEEFSITYGALINIYCELKLATANCTETISTFSGLPTQKDLDSSYKEQYILRKQQHSMQEDLNTIQHQRVIDNQVNTDKIDNLTSEIEILKQQISQLKGLLDNSPNEEQETKNCDNFH